MVIKNLVQIIIAKKKVRVLKLNVPQYHNEYRYELIKHQKLNFLLFLSSSHHSHKKNYFLSFIWRVMKRWDFILLPLFFPLPPTHTLPTISKNKRWKMGLAWWFYGWSDGGGGGGSWLAVGRTVVMSIPSRSSDRLSASFGPCGKTKDGYTLSSRLVGQCIGSVL